MPLAVPNWPTPTGVVIAALFLAVLVSSGLAWSLARRGGSARRRIAELETQLVELRGRSLKRTLRHHFLLNTLNMISTLMHEDVEKADASITSLGGLLRSSLESSERSEIPLEEELELLGHYLAITRARFGSRIHTHLAVEPESLKALVPQLLLQPLVENSVWHVVAKASFPHVIAVTAKRQGDRLYLRVSDDGPGVPDLEAGGLEEGTGLTVTRRRLQLHYGDEQRLAIGNRTSGGLEVMMELPFRVREPDDHSNVDRRRRAVGA